MALQKIQANLDEDLVRELREYAKRMHITQTAAMSVLISSALKQEKALDALDRFVQIYQAEKETGGAD